MKMLVIKGIGCQKREKIGLKKPKIVYKCPLLWSNQLESSDLGTLQMDFSLLFSSFFSLIEKKNQQGGFLCCLSEIYFGGNEIHALNSLKRNKSKVTSFCI